MVTSLTSVALFPVAPCSPCVLQGLWRTASMSREGHRVLYRGVAQGIGGLRRVGQRYQTAKYGEGPPESHRPQRLRLGLSVLSRLEQTGGVRRVARGEVGVQRSHPAEVRQRRPAHVGGVIA